MSPSSGLAAKIVSGGRELSQAELFERVARAASGFLNLGIGVDSAVALMLRNDFPFFEASLAASSIGAQTVPVNWHFYADEAGYILRDCGAKALVVHSDLLPKIAPRSRRARGYSSYQRRRKFKRPMESVPKTPPHPRNWPTGTIGSAVNKRPLDWFLLSSRSARSTHPVRQENRRVFAASPIRRPRRQRRRRCPERYSDLAKVETFAPS